MVEKWNIEKSGPKADDGLILFSARCHPINPINFYPVKYRQISAANLTGAINSINRTS